ncbi:branched-chain amino acid ABC transporter substrate-binding protein [Mesorhizobium sp. 113-3-3]|uniref:branched-chain amino acid ABC transporter substrate-binding protein n=1 Tax=Mesorhizobium sp. 113-3-3 TaxID=2744516 RepID=UPI0018EC0AAB|nr:branched-chain amino acid ABC transporter substrate-binding protein [Mesorhizobium sp. 113-3-3]BCG83849.1 branched chain amino acid ABC transporter substrate-binding protein [Mesorhizobium sp. 113-3-3]
MVDATKNGNGDRKRLRIGVVAPLTGRPADLGIEMAQAVQLAVEDTNGVADDILFEAIRRDDKGDEAEGAKVASSLIADERVLGIVGHYNSNVTLAVAQRYCDASLALISPIVSNPTLTDSVWDNVFRFTNRDDVTASAISDHLAAEMRKRRAVVVRTNTVYGHSMTDEFVHAYRRRGGTVVQDIAVEEGTTEFGGLVGSFPKNIDLVFYGGTFEGAALLKAMRAAKLRHLLATGDGCWDGWNFLEPAGDAAEQDEGVLVLSACPEIGVVQGSRDFAQRYADRFGPLRNYAVNCYDATAQLIEAIRLAQRGNRLSREGVISALRQSQYRGIAYPDVVKWDARQDNGAAMTALHVVEKGRFKQIRMIARASETSAL